MNVMLNGALFSLEKSVNICDLLIQAGYGTKLVAVAVNGDFIPKSLYNDHIIKSRDEIEIVAPMQGG